ncbi:sulfite exporter TauE/SafE family protein [Succinivibrio dextrinosolvens]|uniref:sulfite exporter TauE/SafE family protein n=1 Tax=Succinivibrio dextrinosolvens TaxID=83771 RepID=UPI001923860D|nr:sulfite exporter TauE/SafE family protein [Succinivibrio dextrinosolvens]
MFLGIPLIELVETIAILALCGVVAGFLAGLLGVGGGIIFVPCFTFVFTVFFKVPLDVAVIIATGTSLLCMIPTSISAARSQNKKGNTDMDVIKAWSVAMLVGVFVGIMVSKFLGGAWLTILFGGVMILNSINTLFRAKAKPAFDKLPGKFGQNCIAFCIACFSSMLGIGGGTLTVPVLNACSVPPHKSIGTSSAVSLFVCVPGAILMLFTNLNSTPAGAPLGTFGLVNVLAAICVVPISFFCAPLGVNIGKKIAPVTLKRIFAVALFIISANMLYKGITYYTKVSEPQVVQQVEASAVEQSQFIEEK